jgi:hypothetical protein
MKAINHTIGELMDMGSNPLWGDDGFSQSDRALVTIEVRLEIINGFGRNPLGVDAAIRWMILWW